MFLLPFLQSIQLLLSTIPMFSRIISLDATMYRNVWSMKLVNILVVFD